MSNVNQKVAFLFQGVGVEYKSLLDLLDEEQTEQLKKDCQIVKAEIEMDLWGFLYKSETKHFQPFFYEWIAIYTIDHIIYHKLVSFFNSPEIMLGYSLGLITALTCVDSITFETGLKFLRVIYDYSMGSFGLGYGSMAVIIGMNYNDVQCIIQECGFSDTVEIGSETNEYCIVISGLNENVKKVMEIAAEKGAIKVKDVNSPFAFHSKYASFGIEKYIDIIEKAEISDSSVPIISSLDQRTIQTAGDIRGELIRNMKSSMFWKQSIEKLVKMDIHTFIEVSLSNTVIKFSKIIYPDGQFLPYTKVLKNYSSSNI